MEKELKTCMGVLLRADLTVHGQFSQSADFYQTGWDGCALFGQLSKGRHVECNIVEPYGKRIKNLLGCPFEGRPNRA